MSHYRWLVESWVVLLAQAALHAQARVPSYAFYDTRMFTSASPAAERAARITEPSAPATGDPETAARLYLEDHRDRLGIASTTFFSLPLERRYESETAGLTHLVFRQRHAGIVVFGGEVLAHVGRDGRVLEAQAGAPWPSGAQPILSVGLTAAEAVVAAGRVLAAAPTELRVVSSELGPERQTVLASTQFREPVPARLVWFASATDVRLGWELSLHLDSSHWYSAVVDANTGELLFSHNLYRDNQPRGSVFRAAGVPHPDAGAPTSEPFTGWPATAGDCPTGIYPAQFRSGSLLQRCWVTGIETAGNNVSACLDADGNNQCDWRATNPLAQFAFPFTNSYATTGDAVPDRQAAVTNLFYWNNVLHDWLYSLGFDEASGNLQADNYGRGGFGGDAVQADAQDGAGLNSANFATPPDGSAPRMQAYLFTDNGSFRRRDSAFDGDVLTHEYVHGLTLRLVGGPFDTNSLPLWQSGALGEGWSDAYAASFTSGPVIGEYLSATPATGIRSVAYNNSPHTFGRFGVLYRRNVGPLNLIIDLPQVHRDGEIWATVLWDLRAALGKTTFEQLVTNALKLTPARPSMLDARTALLQAAPALGVSPCTVWTVFAGRGFGASAALNHIQSGLTNDTALSVYEAFDGPASCGGAPPQTGLTLFSDDVESGAGAWTANGLWHVTTRRAASGARSWWYGQEATGNYATGARTSGTLTSPPIDLTGTSRAILEWEQLFLGEGFGRNYNLGATGNDPYLNYDSGWVLVSRDDGVTWETLTTLAHNSSGTVWDPHKIDLSRHAGGIIRLRFLFDSLDANNNTTAGWYVDNVRIRRLLTGTPALRVSPASLSFSATIGAAPAVQTVSVSNADQGVLSWTATPSSSGWLGVSPSSGVGDATLAVTAQPGSLAAGTYTGTITVTAPGATGSPAAVSVTFTIAGPAGEWRFEETGAGPGVTLADSSGNGHAGSTAGYGTISTPGAVGNARLFNGLTDWAEISPSAALGPPSFTCSVWVKLYSYPTTAGWGVVVANYGGNYQGWYLGIHSSGRVIFSVASLPSSAPWLLGTSSLALERWYRVTVTYDGSTRVGAVYLNGAVETTAAFSGFTPQSVLSVTFGRASWFPGYFLHAALDQAILYPVARSAAHVLADYQSFASPPAAPANRDIVSEWRLDDAGSTLTDSSGNVRHGTISGAASAAGARNAARTFNGVTDSARAPASEAWSPVSFTARAWVKLSAYPAVWGVVLSNYGGNYQGWYLGIHSSGRVIFSVGSLPASSPWLLSNTALALNRWYHVTGVYHGATRQAAIYIDGTADSQAAMAGFTPNTSAAVYLARASWYDGYYLGGALDEVRVEAAARTAGEILADFQSFPPPAPTTPVAEWRLDEGGSTLSDSSGHALHATAHGTTSVSGKRNAARRSNGASDWIEVPPAAALSSPSFTLRVWVKLSALPSTWGVVVSNYAGNYQGWYVGVHSSGRVILSVAGLPASAPWLISSAALALGAWHMVTATYDGSTRLGTIYLNGVRDTAAVFPGLTPQATAPFTLGRASWYNGYYLAADLDEVRLMDYSQSPAEVLADYQAFP